MPVHPYIQEGRETIINSLYINPLLYAMDGTCTVYLCHRFLPLVIEVLRFENELDDEKKTMMTN